MELGGGGGPRQAERREGTDRGAPQMAPGWVVPLRERGEGVVPVPRGWFIPLSRDFGASKAYHDQDPMTITDGMKSLKGSVFWMAPEVIKGTGYGRRADVWSLGCTVLEMLSGKHPWPNLENHWSAMFSIAKEEQGPPRPAGVSDLALDFLNKCLQYDPKQRPSATEMLQHNWVAAPEVSRKDAAEVNVHL
eukprot:gene30644-35659_t